MLSIGDRVEYKDARGYVRYVGQLDGKEGTWIGVDWDNADRGRHNGSYKGVSLFHTRHTTSGSFVRAEKLGRSGRQSFKDAVKDRFEASGGAKSIGYLDVSRLGVCSPVLEGSDIELPIDISAVRVLRLSESLLHDFADVYSLLQVFRNLEQFDISHNRFESFPEDASEEDSDNTSVSNCGIHPKLRQLDINRTHLPPHVLLALLARLPNVDDLRIFDIGFTSLEEGLRQHLNSLRVVDLGGNRIPFGDVCSVLGELPHLEVLYLVGGIAEGTERFPVGSFPKLMRLSLSENPIRSWMLFSSMAALPCLRLLQATGTPLTQDDGLEPVDDSLLSRHAIIGRIPQLERLNGTDITADERLYAEKRYFKCCGSLWNKDDDSRFEHAQIPVLAAKHGLDLNNVGNGTGGTAGTLRADLVSVEIRSADQSIRKNLPRSIVAGKLRVLALSLLGLTRDSNRKLTLEHSNSIIDLDGDKMLSEMHVQRGDHVVVILRQNSNLVS